MKNFYRNLLLAAFSLILLIGFSACSSSDEEKFFEEISPETNVRAIHLSPDPDANDPDVDVDYKVIEVEKTIVGLGYGEASAYTEVDIAVTSVIFKDSAGQEIATLDSPGFTEDPDHTVYVVGLDNSLEIIQSDDDRSTESGKVKVRFVHAIPDAPAVDIKLDTPDGTEVFSNADFKTITDYVSVDPDDYTFVVTEAGNDVNEFDAFNPATLEADKVYTIIAHGTVDDTDMFNVGVRVFDDTGSGDTFIDLTRP